LFEQAINFHYDEFGLTNVDDSYFMGYHTPLKKSSDWYEALRATRIISEKITNMINDAMVSDQEVHVFPYRYIFPIRFPIRFDCEKEFHIFYSNLTWKIDNFAEIAINFFFNFCTFLAYTINYQINFSLDVSVYSMCFTSSI